MKPIRFRKLFAIAFVVLITALCTTAQVVRFWRSTTREAVRSQRVSKLKTLYVALAYYADKHGGLPPARAKDGAGAPDVSWRVALLPFLGHGELYSQIDLGQTWNAPSNFRLIERMPKYYQSPVAAAAYGGAANYFAVTGPHAPWWTANSSSPWNTPGLDAVLLVEVPVSKTPWMQPRDPSSDELIAMLQDTGGVAFDSGPQTEIMYVSIRGDVETVAANADPKFLRELFSRGAKPGATGAKKDASSAE